jgi:hypothetical protein
MEKVVTCPAVVCCRSSPGQKADVVKLLIKYTKKSVAAIGKDLVHLLATFLFGKFKSRFGSWH